MSKITNVMISLLEEQAALIHRHINTLKALAGEGNFEETAVHVDAPKKKVKAPVDPNKPKRSLSGYQLFMADKSGGFKEKNPEANATVIMTMVAHAWSILPTEQKDVYLARAEKLKEGYMVEKEAYEVAKAKDISEGTVPAPVEKVKAPKAPKAAASSSSSAAPAVKKVEKVAAPVAAPAAAPVAAPTSTPEKSKKHKRSDSDSSEAVIFTAPEGAETDKKKKKHKKDKK